MRKFIVMSTWLSIGMTLFYWIFQALGLFNVAPAPTTATPPASQQVNQAAPHTEVLNDIKDFYQGSPDSQAINQQINQIKNVQK